MLQIRHLSHLHGAKLFGFRRYLSMETTKTLLPEFSVRIKYPEPNFNYRQNDIGVVATQVPVVLIFGWAGSQDKHLRKYSEIYENHGLVVASCRAPLSYLMKKTNCMKHLSESLVQHLAENKLDSRPTFVHLMSNGGASLYYCYAESARKAGVDSLCKGIVFDSSPAAPRLLGTYRVISSIIGGPLITNVPLTVLSAIFAILFNRIRDLINYDNNITLSTIYNRLLNDKSTCPQHFIYSKADKMTFYDDVERFIQYRAKKKGINVSKLRFDDSEHVQHFAQHKELYSESISTFLRNCLENKSNNVKVMSKI